MDIKFEKKAQHEEDVINKVKDFLKKVPTIEKEHNMNVIIFQDGVNGSYYIKCSIQATNAAELCDLDARLDVCSTESYRANRELLLKHATFLKMQDDVSKGREFNDIIVEYNTDYNLEIPLKVWGGQHRIKAIQMGGISKNRYHGFRIYFTLNKEQRTEVALISNTNISVSNDTFDRMVEETTFGDKLRVWCKKIGFLNTDEDFPDVGTKSDKITVKLARSFIVNFYKGKEKGDNLEEDKLDKTIFEPYLAETGVILDKEYENIMKTKDILGDNELIEAGKNFLNLHIKQQDAVKDKNNKIVNRKQYRNKALIESVLTGWSFVAGLLQSHKERLQNHYEHPKTNKKILDPLNAIEMSQYRHDKDPATYRGLGTRSSIKDRQRLAQLFLAKSNTSGIVIDKKLMEQAVSQIEGLKLYKRGYTK